MLNSEPDPFAAVDAVNLFGLELEERSDRGITEITIRGIYAAKEAVGR
ncbi:MAG: hypothetical protein KME06_01235 [Kastovskya adunca ATA6-11-RM4]|nr:hypothetical protein [Kastovskya adunca ATA6-11-RM4]